VIDIPGVGTQNFKVKHFEDVNGTENNDTIIGNDKNNTINGGGGDDVLAGVSGLGSFPGLNEIDVLTGGTGSDKFIMGSGSTLYYNGNGNSDYAKITDFSNGADKIALASGNYATDADVTQLFAINVGQNGVETLDLIAKIAYAPGSIDFSAKKSAEVVLSDNPVAPLSTTNTFSLSAGQSFGNFIAA
jgi:Ca2+-binding RTX toxin-like protein